MLFGQQFIAIAVLIKLFAIAFCFDEISSRQALSRLNSFRSIGLEYLSEFEYVYFF